MKWNMSLIIKKRIGCDCDGTVLLRVDFIIDIFVNTAFDRLFKNEFENVPEIFIVMDTFLVGVLGTSKMRNFV
jgi:hypothetical protein